MPGRGEESEVVMPPLKSYATVLRHEISLAEEELERPARGLLVSGLLGGFGVGISLLLIGVILDHGADLPDLVRRLAVAIAYSVGFIIVIMGRTDLFTEYSTIAILPVLTGDSTIGRLARLWGLIYVANLAGATAIAALSVTIGPGLGIMAPATFGEIARHLLDHTWPVLLLSGFLAGWLMGFLSWLVASGRDTTSQILFILLITGAIGLLRLHHSVVGTVEVLAGIFARQGVSGGDLGRFLFWVTLGNSVGGIIFAVLMRFSGVMHGPR